MSELKKKDLKEGEIYKIIAHNTTYIYKISRIIGTMTRTKTGSINNNKLFSKTDTELDFADTKYDYIWKLATPEEKHWLNTCIEQDKFVSYEEALKTFIPEYVELLLGWSVANEFVGEIFSTKKDFYEQFNKFRAISKNDNWEKVFKYWYPKHFKPSTKEAYDAQFKDNFVLPEKWYIKRNSENAEVLNNWENNRVGRKVAIFNYNNCSMFSDKDYNFTNSLNISGYTEITFEQFKKYVLKEEILEEKVIQPLPQFKVIETIETITKVENNEGNQFFIGDTVKSLDSNQKGEITKFRYSADKSNIIAITTFQSNNGIGIDKIEHYIEPKVEFILPEKWSVKVTNRNLDYFKSLSGYKFFNLGNWSSIIGLNNACDTSNVGKQYVEITFDQFKKYVLKEAEPIIIAESHKDMLDLKTKGINSIVLPQETLLEQAKRLYPIGTMFNNNNIKQHVTKEHISNGEVRQCNYGEITVNTSCGLYTIYDPIKKLWAEIIGYEPQIGDKFNKKDFSYPTYDGKFSNTTYTIVSFKGSYNNPNSVITFREDNWIGNHTSTILLKNIKIIK